jgi:hypothetical protein
MGQRHKDSEKLRSLKQVREIHDWALLNHDGNSAARDAQLADEIAKFGVVAGYPKLDPGFWDDGDFMLLPGMLIFDGKLPPDEAWSNHLHDRDRLLVATSDSGFINTELKYEWYKRCKRIPFCPFGRKPTIPQADGHASNESVEMSAEMELQDEAYLIEPCGHSTHITQQLDQTGGPIQHFKRIGRALLRNLYRLRGKFSRATIARAVELAYVLSFTPAVCSWATEHVGWGEDSEGRLVYDPLSRPHILARLDDDESPAAAAPGPAVVTENLSSQERLLAFHSGAMDGRAGIEAGRKAALEVLGRSTGENDGWSDVDPNEAIEEDGSRARRNANPNGRIVGEQEFRDGRSR